MISVNLPVGVVIAQHQFGIVLPTHNPNKCSLTYGQYMEMFIILGVGGLIIGKGSIGAVVNFYQRIMFWVSRNRDCTRPSLMRAHGVYSVHTLECTHAELKYVSYNHHFLLI